MWMRKIFLIFFSKYQKCWSKKWSGQASWSHIASLGEFLSGKWPWTIPLFTNLARKFYNFGDESVGAFVPMPTNKKLYNVYLKWHAIMYNMQKVSIFFLSQENMWTRRRNTMQCNLQMSLVTPVMIPTPLFRTRLSMSWSIHYFNGNAAQSSTGICKGGSHYTQETIGVVPCW